MTMYTSSIETIARRVEPTLRYDLAIIEAWMRLEHGTLDHLDPVAFEREVVTALHCADMSTPEENLQLAASYGLAVLRGAA